MESFDDSLVKDKPAKAYLGVDRGFIFFEDTGIPWRGITSVEEDEEDHTIERLYIDGRKVAHRNVGGVYTAKVTSYDDPFNRVDIFEDEVGFSYRERYEVDGEEFYRLHLVHAGTVQHLGTKRESVNATPTPNTMSWDISTRPVRLGAGFYGSHLILDSSEIYDWILRDIENVLYGWLPNTTPRIPDIEEIYEIFATMNLVIIDHGDGTWSAVGHHTMIQMLDTTEFQITTPTAEMLTEYEYSIESLVRDERWLE